MNTASPPILLRVRDLSVRAAGRLLLAPCSFELHEGERALIVGPSGSGKSLFCDLILGFAGPETPGLEITGSILLEGEELLGRPPQTRATQHLGAVFQLHTSGLFDDLSVEQNLRFGSSEEAERTQAASDLNLGERTRLVTDCSGGERMRIGLARTLLHGADVLLLDEPTTGLDPASAAQVVTAIHESHRRLSLVVTHDYASFADRADVVLFLDPRTRTLERVAGGSESLDAVAQALAGTTAPTAEERTPRPSLGSRLAQAWRRLAVGTVDLLLQAAVLVLLPATLLRIVHPLDGPRIRAALRRDLAPGVALFIGISAVLVAFTGTWFLFERLPKRPYTEPLILEELLGALGLVLTRVGVPLMVSVLLAAKLGATDAAHLGHMSLTRQIDALRLLRIAPQRHLLLPAAVGQLAASWASTALALGLAYGTALLVFLGTHAGLSARYFHRSFTKNLDGTDLFWIAAKVGLSALAVALVAYRVASTTKRDPEQVVRGIHATLLRGLVLVLAIHAGFAFLEF